MQIFTDTVKCDSKMGLLVKLRKAFQCSRFLGKQCKLSWMEELKCFKTNTIKSYTMKYSGTAMKTSTPHSILIFCQSSYTKKQLNVSNTQSLYFLPK